MPLEPNSSAVKVPRGSNLICTVKNTTAKIVLLKHTVDGSELNPADWSLTATPASGVDGLAEHTVDKGADKHPSSDDLSDYTFELRPGHNYTLSEEARAGIDAKWRLIALEKWDASEQVWVEAESETVTVAAGQTGVYRFVNGVSPSIPGIPMTGGIGEAAFLIGGGGLLVAITGIAIYRWRRRAGDIDLELTPTT